MKTFNRIFFISSIILIFFLTTSCTTLTPNISVKTHASSGIDFNKYKSYAWLNTAQIVFDPIGQWEQPTLDTDEKVKFSINQELRAKGLFEAQNAPDLLVTFAAGIDTVNMGLVQNPDSKKDILANIPKAALVIALIDASTGYTVWLGFAEGYVQPQQTIKNIHARIDYAVNRIFKTYNK